MPHVSLTFACILQTAPAPYKTRQRVWSDGGCGLRWRARNGLLRLLPDMRHNEILHNLDACRWHQIDSYWSSDNIGSIQIDPMICACPAQLTSSKRSANEVVILYCQREGRLSNWSRANEWRWGHEVEDKDVVADLVYCMRDDQFTAFKWVVDLWE